MLHVPVNIAATADFYGKEIKKIFSFSFKKKERLHPISYSKLFVLQISIMMNNNKKLKEHMFVSITFLFLSGEL